jgi:phosphate:Na+ symporter
MIKMGDLIMENFKLSTSMLEVFDEKKIPIMEENERFIDRCETDLSSYIVRIDRKRLTSEDKLTVYEILNSIGDYERMGDYCMYIFYVAKSKNEQKIKFSNEGNNELKTVIDAVSYTLEMTTKSFNEDDINLSIRVEPLLATVNELNEVIKSHHVQRLQEGKCSIEAGISFFDLLNSFERISAHASNVSLHVIKKVKNDRDFDEMHGHAQDKHSEEYKALYHYYKYKYRDNITLNKD